MKLTKIQREKRKKIITSIYTYGEISRIDISKITGITPAIVTDITRTLINEHLVEEIGEEEENQIKAGRKKILLKISPQHSYYIGIELSEKFFSFVICDNKGNVFEEEVILSMNSSETLSIERFYDYCEQFIKKNQHYHIKAIGIALPGHFSEVTQSIRTNNPYWKSFIFDLLPNFFDGPIFFHNNVECMALSERLFNSTLSNQNYSILHVGRGMFCSTIYDGRLYGSTNVLVGEIGHMVVHPNGELCECGKRGCLQTYASEAWIIKKSQLLYENSETTYLRQLCLNPESLAIETILTAYKLGDEGVTNILHNALRYLAITLNNFRMMIDSDQIIIHGELFNEVQLFDLLKKHIDEEVSLFNTTNKQSIVNKKFKLINGAIAATGLCIERILLN